MYIPAARLAGGLGLKVAAGCASASGELRATSAREELEAGTVPCVLFTQFSESKPGSPGAAHGLVKLEQHDVLVGVQGRDVRGQPFTDLRRVLGELIKAGQRNELTTYGLHLRFWRSWAGPWEWKGAGPATMNVINTARARGIAPPSHAWSARIPMGGTVTEVGSWPPQERHHAAWAADAELLTRTGWTADAGTHTNFFRHHECVPEQLVMLRVLNPDGSPRVPRNQAVVIPDRVNASLPAAASSVFFKEEHCTASNYWSDFMGETAVAHRQAGEAGPRPGAFAPANGHHAAPPHHAALAQQQQQQQAAAAAQAAAQAAAASSGGLQPPFIPMRALMGGAQKAKAQLKAQIFVMRFLMAGDVSGIPAEHMHVALHGDDGATAAAAAAGSHKRKGGRNAPRTTIASQNRDGAWASNVGSAGATALPTRQRAVRGRGGSKAGTGPGRKRGKKKRAGDSGSDSDASYDEAGGDGSGYVSRRSGRSRSSKSKFDDSDLDGELEGEKGGAPDSPPALADEFKVEVVLGVRYADMSWHNVQRAKALVESGQVSEEVTHGPIEWSLLKRVGGPDSDSSEVATPEDELEGKRRDRAMMQARLALWPDYMNRRAFNNLEYLVKYKGIAYTHAEWVAHSFLLELNRWAKKKAEDFRMSQAAVDQMDEEESRLLALRELPTLDAYIPSEMLEVERVLNKRVQRLSPTDAPVEVFLVKWAGLPYSECTWETRQDVASEQAIQQYEIMNTVPNTAELRAMPPLNTDRRPSPSLWRRHTESPMFRGGRTLRDYQLEGLNWLTWNWYNYRNSILADEMGLGKTIQSVSYLNHLVTREHVRGPFLIIAPLSTLGHWEREINTWTSMQAVLYHDTGGGATGREVIRNNLWHFKDKDAQGNPVGTGENSKFTNHGVYKFHVLLTSYQTLNNDWDYLSPICWRAAIVDEAQALKNTHSQLSISLRGMDIKSLVLLTGTPLQNDITELWSLLNMVDPAGFASLDAFNAEFGDLKETHQVTALQAKLRPLMLRRVKTDVEKSLPPKEETIVSIELTSLQRQYYRAVFERNRDFLAKGATGIGAANLTNIEMELRKCCNHPYLLRGVEERETARLLHAMGGQGGTAEAQRAFDAQRIDRMVVASGKMLVLDKLLKWLKDGGHRVLLFSQFAIQLDIVEEFCAGRGYGYERIDGSIRGDARQASIDRFNDPKSSSFIFLLSTRAGGVGINLTSADTVIIFDSDWNPQNDVQAQARAHRIGQKAELVRVFRLVTSRTYEGEMFRRASRKLGLHQAVFETGALGDGVGGGDEEADDGAESLTSLLRMDKSKVEALLRFGAYAIMEDEEAGGAVSAKGALPTDSIEAIMAKSATIRYSADGAVERVGAGGAEGGEMVQAGGGGDGLLHFKNATFASAGNDVDVKDPSFWQRVLGPRHVERLLRTLEDGRVVGMGSNDATASEPAESLATGEAATQGSAAEDATAASDTPKPLREPKEGETSVAQFLADVRFVISKLIGAADSTDEDTLVNASSDATSAATLLTRIRVLGKGVSLPEGGLPLPSFPPTDDQPLPHLPLPGKKKGQSGPITLEAVAEEWNTALSKSAKKLQTALKRLELHPSSRKARKDAASPGGRRGRKRRADTTGEAPPSTDCHLKVRLRKLPQGSVWLPQRDSEHAEHLAATRAKVVDPEQIEFRYHRWQFTVPVKSPTGAAEKAAAVASGASTVPDVPVSAQVDTATAAAPSSGPEAPAAAAPAPGATPPSSESTSTSVAHTSVTESTGDPHAPAASAGAVAVDAPAGEGAAPVQPPPTATTAPPPRVAAIIHPFKLVAMWSKKSENQVRPPGTPRTYPWSIADWVQQSLPAPSDDAPVIKPRASAGGDADAATGGADDDDDDDDDDGDDSGAESDNEGGDTSEQPTPSASTAAGPGTAPSRRGAGKGLSTAGGGAVSAPPAVAAAAVASTAGPPAQPAAAPAPAPAPAPGAQVGGQKRPASEMEGQPAAQAASAAEAGPGVQVPTPAVALNAEAAQQDTLDTEAPAAKKARAEDTTDMLA